MGYQDKTDDLFHDYYDPRKLAKFEAEVDKQSQQESDDESRDNARAEAVMFMEEDGQPSASAQTEDEAEDSYRSDESRDENGTGESDVLSKSGWQPSKYQMAIGGVFFAICVSMVAYGLARLVIGRPQNDRELTFTEVYRGPMDLGMTDIIDFARFLVPFPDEDDRAYLLLSVSVKPSDRDVYNEINAKKIYCRGAIYAGIKKAISASKKKMISGVELKRYILNAFEGVLISGTLQDVYFTEFLVE